MRSRRSSHDAPCPFRRDKLRPVAKSRGMGLADPLKLSKNIEYAKASFERFEPRPGRLRSLARVKRLLNQSVVDRAREHGNVVLLVQTSRAFSSQRIIHNLCEAIASRQ
jgi:DNA repair protein RadC